MTGRYCHSLFWTSSAKSEVCLRDSAHKDCPKTHKVSCTDALERLTGRRKETTQAPELPKKGSSHRHSSDTRARESKSSHRSEKRDKTVKDPRTKRTSAHPSVVALPRSDSSSSLRFMVMGDIGRPNRNLHNTIEAARLYYSGSHLTSALILGDNLYTHGVSSVHDPLFKAIFEDILVPSFPRLPFHMILGNHDWKGNVEAQVAYRHAQWIMPSFYYSRKFHSGDTTACVWFLETEKLNEGEDQAQLAWLEHSLRTDSGVCDWKIVTGHRPIFTAGQYQDKKSLIRDLLPILEQNGVSLYISGHEHQTQILHNRDRSPITFIIAGCTIRKRSRKQQKDHDMLVWADSDRFAFVDLTVTKNQLRYTVINAEVDGHQSALYQGTIRRSM
jgi:tartrate-resistant acid phosphatase type 5